MLSFGSKNLESKMGIELGKYYLQAKYTCIVFLLMNPAVCVIFYDGKKGGLLNSLVPTKSKVNQILIK